MNIPINTAPLKALDVPTRWLLTTALEDGALLAEREIIEADEVEAPPAVAAELRRKRDVYRTIAEALR